MVGRPRARPERESAGRRAALMGRWNVGPPPPALSGYWGVLGHWEPRSMDVTGQRSALTDGDRPAARYAPLRPSAAGPGRPLAVCAR